MSCLSKGLATIMGGSFCLLVFAISGSQEVFLESLESKTVSGGPVFNRIKWLQFEDYDVWMMNQSHHGFSAPQAAWDRLAIVVDKTKNPKTARFYELEPGPLEWNEKLARISYKVSCFMCHNNGPRAIRPKYNSPFDPTSLGDKIKVAYWNLRIKTYGRVLADAAHDQEDLTMLPPFRFRSSFENEALKVATCVKCHKESGFLARGLLRRQQIPTIKFMLESGQMPPTGFSLSEKERLELERFLLGF